MAKNTDENMTEDGLRHRAAEYLLVSDPALAAMVVSLWTRKHKFFLVQQTVMAIYSDALDKVLGEEK